VDGLLFGSFCQLQEQIPLAGVGLGLSDLAVEPRRFLLVIPAVRVGVQARLSVLVPAPVLFLVLVPVIVLVVVLILVPVLVLLVFFFFFVRRARPALGLLRLIEIHLVPGLEIDLLDIPVEIFDLDELRVLIDRQDAEGLFLLEVLVPLAGDRLVVSAHDGNS